MTNQVLAIQATKLSIAKSKGGSS